MNAIVNFVLRIVGGLFLLAAFLQWITYDYPDVSPFVPGPIFAPGMISQMFNWLFVVFLGTVGCVMIGFARRARQK